jgi:hypothetical protein
MGVNKGIRPIQILDLCMLHDNLPLKNEQICGHRLTAIN